LVFNRESLVVEVFKCLVNLINGSPREFGDIIEVFKKYIEHSDHSYSKTLSIESIIYLAQNGYFLSLLLGNETERATFISILVAF
jgi:hypothetical protein